MDTLTRTISITSIPPRPLSLSLLHRPIFRCPQERQLMVKVLLPTALPFHTPLSLSLTLLLPSTLTITNPIPPISPRFQPTPFPAPSLTQQTTITTGLDPTLQPRRASLRQGLPTRSISSTTLQHTRPRCRIQLLNAIAGKTTRPNFPLALPSHHHPATTTTTEGLAAIYPNTPTQ